MTATEDVHEKYTRVLFLTELARVPWRCGGVLSPRCAVATTELQGFADGRREAPSFSLVDLRTERNRA